MILYWSSLHIALVCCLSGLSPSEIERYGASFVRFKDPDGPEMHKDPCNLGSAKKKWRKKNTECLLCPFLWGTFGTLYVNMSQLE